MALDFQADAKHDGEQSDPFAVGDEVGGCVEEGAGSFRIVRRRDGKPGFGEDPNIGGQGADNSDTAQYIQGENAAGICWRR